MKVFLERRYLQSETIKDVQNVYGTQILQAKWQTTAIHQDVIVFLQIECERKPRVINTRIHAKW